MSDIGYLIGWLLVYYCLKDTIRKEKKEDDDDPHIGIGA